MASPDLNAVDVAEILATAKAFNSENNITGCLMYFNNEFVQILEGAEKDVLAIYEKIKKDKRYSFVLLLGTGTKTTRLFPTSSMAFQDLNKTDDKKSAAVFTKNFIEFSALSDKPTVVVELFFQISKHVLTDTINKKIG
ncbi:MAG: hypothetical protein ACI9JN_001677 [Bacteroidia bacterium]|jgi:hypothetical protein